MVSRGVELKNYAFVDIYRREIGCSSCVRFTRRNYASEAPVKRLGLYRKLNGHEGCVNAVEFNSTGDLLVSGSDDRYVIIWNWQANSRVLSYYSGHSENVFQTRIMPFSGDGKIVTSAADGQVRLGHISEGGRVETRRLGGHQRRVFKLALDSGSPNIIYSCGEDGLVQQFDIRTNTATKLLHCRSFSRSSRSPVMITRLNTIAIDPRNPNYFCVGGSDEYARLFDVRRCQWAQSNELQSPVNTFCPRHLVETNRVHISGLAYSNTSELLISYNDELIYLFQKNMGMGPKPFSFKPEELQHMDEPQVYMGHRNARTVKGVTFFGLNDDYVLSGSDCGHIFIWKKEGGKLVHVMAGDRHIVNQLECHPHIPILATCGIESSVKIWSPESGDAALPPEKVDKIVEHNRRGREDRSQVSLAPEVSMHVLRLQRRQAAAFIEREYDGVDIDSDGGGELNSMSFSDGDDSTEEGENSRDCNIS